MVVQVALDRLTRPQRRPLQGRLVEGFADYAWRMKCKELNIDPRNFSQPKWDGTPQPGDTGALVSQNGARISIATAIYTDAAKSEIAHVPAAGTAPLKVGDAVTAFHFNVHQHYIRLQLAY